MKWEKEFIGSCTLKVKNINPAIEYATDNFSYVDISSVNSSNKSIIGCQTLEGNSAPSRARQVLKEGDILVSTVRPNLNAVAYVPKEFDDAVASTGFCVLRSNENKLMPRYLYYWVRSNAFVDDMVKKATGASYPAVSDTIIKQSEIPLPSLHIQQQISDTLDKADTLRRKDQELLNKYDELAQAFFYDMFGENIKPTNRAAPLSEFVKLNPVKSEIELKDTSEVSFVGMSSVGEDGTIDTSIVRSFREVKTGYTYFRENDVLFAKITPCMENGKGAIAKGLKNGIGFGSTEFHVLRPGVHVTSEFLYYLLSLKNVRTKAEMCMTGSAGQRRVPINFFNKLKITAPENNKLIQFNYLMENLKINRSKILTNINQSEHLFNTLLSTYFN